MPARWLSADPTIGTNPILTPEERQRSSPLVPAWTQNNTAELLGVSPPTVTRKLFLARAMEIMPELRDEESESAALRKIDRRLDELERELAFRTLKAGGKLEEEGQVLLGDCAELLEKLDDQSIDCIIIDPLYGVLEAGGIGRYEQHFDDDPGHQLCALFKLSPKDFQTSSKTKCAHIYILRHQNVDSNQRYF